jgi:hypothetical protein
LAGILCSVHPAAAGDHSLGLGIHYWDYIDDIDIDEYDDSGYSWVASYQYKPGFTGFQLDVEFADDQLGAIDKWTFSPQAYVTVGNTIYGGVGIGVHYADGNSSDPFYALKGGIDFELLPGIHLDINANYRFENWDMDEVGADVDTDTVTLGAIVRIGF